MERECPMAVLGGGKSSVGPWASRTTGSMILKWLFPKTDIN